MAGKRMYPTLEDMKVDQVLQAQVQAHVANASGPGPYNYPIAGTDPQAAPSGGSLYPSLASYMGLDVAAYQQQFHMAPYAQQGLSVAVRPTTGGALQVAPVTGNDVGVRRAEIQPGVRQVVLCKNRDGKVGLRVRHFDTGIFVCFVEKDSPAAMAGLRFGDQVLQINDESVCGWDTDKFHKAVKKADPQQIALAIRDRPFARTITTHKDSSGHVGFTFKDGRINAIVKDSSAARNGLLTDHQLIEVDGSCVVGFKDSKIGDIIRAAPGAVTVTVMPMFLYEHIIKCMGKSLFDKQDHSVPDI